MTPWNENKAWKTRSAYFAWLRGVLRRGWSKSPIKIAFKNSVRFKIPNPNPKGRVKEVWGHECNICGYVGPEKEFEVDHKIPAGKLNDWSDVGPFTQRLLGCSEDNLQMLCKANCHPIKSYSERMDISFDEAKIRKQIIAFKKLSLPQMKEKIREEGGEGKGLTSKAQASKMYEELLRSHLRSNLGTGNSDK